MRPPSRIALPLITTALLVLGSAATASAESSATGTSIDAMQLSRLTNVSIDQAYDAVNTRIDERLAMAFAGPSSMECSKSRESGFETCVVRTQGSTSVPSSLAQN